MQKSENTRPDEQEEQGSRQNETDNSAADGVKSDETQGEPDTRYNELNDKYLRLYSEYDNYRRRTIKERAELLKTAAEDAFKAVLPALDDLERAMKANEEVNDAPAIKEGVKLIYNKLKNNVSQKGLVAFDSVGQPFDPDTMEAITHIPVENAAQKGKVVDEVEKGYKLGDKVIRYAKVVVGQ